MNLVNGLEADTVSVHDRGLMYGDGVFRTFVMRAGVVALWRRHYAKLAADCAALRIECPHAATVAQDLAAIAARQPDCVIKIVVTRGPGARGYAIPKNGAPTRIVHASALPQYPASHYASGVRARLCRTRLSVQPALAGIKHLNRLEHVLARSEWADPDIAEGLMCDSDGNVVCGTMTNLFVVEDGTVATPSVARCGVAGVQRARVLELAQARPFQIRESDISVERLLAAHELFVTNSVIGIWQIARLERKTWGAAPMTAQVRNWLNDGEDD